MSARDKWDEAFYAALAEIKSRYPSDEKMTEQQSDEYSREVQQAYMSTLPETREEWLEHYGDFPCLSCGHYGGMNKDGRVTCRDVTVVLPHGTKSVSRKTWQFRYPSCWTEYAGRKRANCDEYAKRKKGS